MKQSPVPASRLVQLQDMYLLLLPCCTVIAAAGYHINSNNSKSQKQPINGYKVTSKSLPGQTLLTGVKIITDIIQTIIQVC